jgi:UDP-2,3-diacylglucosamine pyrophosphatase LpxH
MPGDTGYSVIRAFLRNRFVIAAAKTLHPDLMDALASRVSDASKTRNHRSVEDTARRLAARPPETFFCRGNDIFVIGHIHYPLHKVIQGKDLVIVGDWITQFTFARLRDGRISIETFKRGATD